MAQLEREIAKYEELRSELERDHFGQWVVIYSGKLVGTYDDFQEAARNAVQNFGRGPYLIRQVGAPPMVMPASLLYRPV